MSRRLLPALLPLLALAWTVHPAIAQSAESAVEIGEVEVDGYPEILVLVTAPSQFRTTDLGPSDWVVTEDGERQEVSEAIRVAGEDIEAVLVLDTSGSMAGEALSTAITAAEGFLDSLPPGTRVALVTFGTESTVAAAFTDDLEGLRSTLGSLEASGETALYDAVIQAAGLFSTEDDVRRSMIVLTDGADTASEGTETQAASAVNDVGVTFFAIELETAETQAEPLASLATATGGTKVGATPSELGTVYDEIASRITSMYLLRYDSTASGRIALGIALNQEGDVEPAAINVRYPVTGSVAPGATTAPSPSDVPATPPATLAGSPPSVPTFGAENAIWYGLGAVFIGMSALIAFLLRPGSPKQTTVRPSFRTSRQRAVSSTARTLVGAVDRITASRGTGGIDGRLERAGMALRPGEYLVLSSLAVLVAFVGGLALYDSSVLALLLATVVALASMALLRMLGNRRQRAFESQLPDVLTMLASTIRTGYAPLQATEQVARESSRPSREELSRVVAEARLGRDYIDAMAAAAVRTQSTDLQWVVEAMEINRDVGGDVSELLDTVAETIRERVMLQRMISALSAEGRLSAWILIALPFGLAFFLNTTNPDYLKPLFEHPIGIVMVIGATISIGLGIWFISRVLDLEA